MEMEREELKAVINEEGRTGNIECDNKVNVNLMLEQLMHQMRDILQLKIDGASICVKSSGCEIRIDIRSTVPAHRDNGNLHNKSNQWLNVDI